MRSVQVICPACKKTYMCESSLLAYRGIRLHCPFCHHYFTHEESPTAPAGGSVLAGLGRPIGPDIIYNQGPPRTD